MKTLILMRHSNAESLLSSDFDRPLSLPGRENARLAAEHLNKMRLVPDIIFTSPMARARQTADIIAEHMHGKVQETEKLSGILTAQDLINALSEQFSRYDLILAIGHNPNISQTAQLLAGQFISFSPAEFAVFDMTLPSQPKLLQPGVRP